MQWPGRGIGPTLHALDTAPILEAAGRAQVLFAEREESGADAYTSVTAHCFADPPRDG